MERKGNTSIEYKYSTYNIFKFMCNVARYTCCENFWYETKENGRLLFVGYLFLSFYYFTAFGNVSLEAILNTYPKDEHRDAMLVSSAQTVLLFRVFFYSYKKKEIKDLMKDMVDNCREYEMEYIYLKQFKKIRFCLIFHIAIYYSLELSFVIDGLKKYFYKDKPLVLLPGYWPKYEDDTTIGIIFKCYMYLYVVTLAATIVTKDSLVIVKLIVLSYKFKTLRQYFENMWKDFDKATISMMELKNKCLRGILMHQELLRITKKFRKLYNVVISIEVLQGSGVVILVMLKLMFTSDKTFTNIIISILYLGLFVGQLALFMWNAGEITYQASLLHTSMFNSGWHMRPVNCEDSRLVRRLVLMGCIQAQKPLVLKAFGIQDVSYSSFVSVIQTSYSIFAVFRTSY